MTEKTIRLRPEAIEILKISFRETFEPGDELWIFGSRVNPEAKGGDIDLYVRLQDGDTHRSYVAENNFYKKLMDGLGEQKIDIVVDCGNIELPIYEIARRKGVRLV